MAKLTRFIDSSPSVFAFAASSGTSAALQSYTYLQSAVNMDFEEGAAYLTPYNAVDAKSPALKKGAPPVKGVSAAEFKSYSNICGLLALNADGMKNLALFHHHMLACKDATPPAYD